MADYLFYFKSSTFKEKIIDYSASNQFSKIQRGDTLWIVQMLSKRLFLIGRLAVSRRVDRAEAERSLGRKNLWEARYYALTKNPEPHQQIDITDVAVRLRFRGNRDRLPSNFTGQHLQSIRTLTGDSPALLQDYWSKKMAQQDQVSRWTDRKESQLGSSVEVGELGLPVHQRFGRREVFKTFGIEYSSQQQHLNTGLSPRNPDGGYCIFVTLNKSDLPDVYDYDDELFQDRIHWVTRRGRDEQHPDYVNLRKSGTRVSLLVRGNKKEQFAYLGELKYRNHRESSSASRDKIQQEYAFLLNLPIPSSLYAELTENRGSSKRLSRSDGRRSLGEKHGRRPSNLDSYKKEYSYVLSGLDRTVSADHVEYQIRLGKYLKKRGVRFESERDYIDVRFWCKARLFIGEIKVTSYMTVVEAFRAALGQLLVYGHTKVDEPHCLVMFLDAIPPSSLLELADRLGIAVVIEANESYTLANKTETAALHSAFPSRES